MSSTSSEGRHSRELIEAAEKRVFRIAEAGARGVRQFVPVRDAAREALDLLHERFHSDSPITGLATGFSDFDHMTAGLQPGDLVYIPGHVMMTIGTADGLTWMIHDTNGGSFLGLDGKRVSAQLNGVSVTPLEPMLASDTATYVDRMTNIQRIRNTGKQ